MTAGELGSILEPEAAEAAFRPTDPRRRGVFVTFEGIEGSGKSTQILRLAETLRERGESAVVTREPGGTELGRRLRAVLLDAGAPVPRPETELFLYAADRAQHVVEVVAPALARGAIVLCDRYLDATLAYQGRGRGLGFEPILALHRRPPLDLRPDRTILLDLDPATGLDRALARNRDRGIERAEGRYEAESIAFHRRVRDGYLELAAADPFRFRIVDAEEPPERVAARIRDLLSDAIPCLDDDEEPA